MKRLLLTMAWLMLCSSAHAAPPGSIHASYDVFSHGMKIGQLDEIYTRNKDSYTLTSTTTPLGLLAVFKPGKTYLNSNGLITRQGLRPLHFAYKDENKPDKDSQAELDWTEKKITLTHLPTTLDLPDGTQDRLSAMYQFMFLQLEHVATLDFPMTNGSKLDNYHYAVGSMQKISTPAGKLDSLYLDSEGKKGENRTEIWLAVKKYNLPCKMIITDSGGTQITQILSRLKITP